LGLGWRFLHGKRKKTLDQQQAVLECSPWGGTDCQALEISGIDNFSFSAQSCLAISRKSIENGKYYQPFLAVGVGMDDSASKSLDLCTKDSAIEDCAMGKIYCQSSLEVPGNDSHTDLTLQVSDENQ
jgi:hypothetical protein